MPDWPSGWQRPGEEPRRPRLLFAAEWMTGLTGKGIFSRRPGGPAPPSGVESPGKRFPPGAGNDVLTVMPCTCLLTSLRSPPLRMEFGAACCCRDGVHRHVFLLFHHRGLIICMLGRLPGEVKEEERYLCITARKWSASGESKVFAIAELSLTPGIE